MYFNSFNNYLAVDSFIVSHNIIRENCLNIELLQFKFHKTNFHTKPLTKIKK